MLEDLATALAQITIGADSKLYFILRPKTRHSLPCFRLC